MSDHKDDDEFTKIEDLPDLDDLKNSEDDSFVSLEELAKGLNISDLDNSDDIDNLSDENEDLFSSTNHPEPEPESDFSDTFNLSDEFDDQSDNQSEDNNVNDFDDSFSESADEGNALEDNLDFDTHTDEQFDNSFSYGQDEQSSEPIFDNEEIFTDVEKQEFDNTEISLDENLSALDMTDSLPESFTDNVEENADKQSEANLDELSDTLSDESIDNEDVAQTHKTPIPTNNTTSKSIIDIDKDIEEIKQFGDQSTFSGLNSEGNPPYSIIIKNPKYIEDAEAIISDLCELNIFTPDEKEENISKLTNGQLLLPRLSEFSAIYICHKIRQYDIEILMGLTEELQPRRSYNSNDRGLITKFSIINNKSHNINFEKLDHSDILTTTLPYIEGHHIEKYLGIITSSQELHLKDITQMELGPDEINELGNPQELQNEMVKLQNQESLKSSDKINFDASPSKSLKSDQMSDIYQYLIKELINKALSKNAHAIIGITFSIHPISVTNDEDSTLYKVQCTGNMVWLKKA